MDEAEKLYRRGVAPAIREALEDTPVVCLLGPRQSGKTTLVRSQASGHEYVSLDNGNYYRAAKADPIGFLEDLPKPITLDEVQHVPELLPAIKLAVDNDRAPGRFLLTGSANLLLLPQVNESLAGRMEVVQLHPLTEAEKNRSPGRFLETLLAGQIKPSIKPDHEWGGENIRERLIAGGYPEPISRSPMRARQWHRQYLRSIIERDVRDVARLHDAHELSRLLEILALRSAELVNVNTLTGDMKVSRGTIERMLAVLERLFLVRQLPAWHRNTAKRLIKSPKIHLLDSGLAATLAGLEADDWIEKRELMGHILESFVVQQVIAQAGWTNPDLRFWHYRDKDQVEVDVVITKGRMTWGIEVKSARTLKRNDGRGLSLLAGQCGKDFQQGILLYGGSDVLPLSDKRMLAVPISTLWEI